MEIQAVVSSKRETNKTVVASSKSRQHFCSSGCFLEFELCTKLS